MSILRRAALAAWAIVLWSGPAAAQTAQTAPAAPRPWSFYASAYTYILENDDDYLQPTLSADRGRLHLEARFNYEDRKTGSGWAGYNVTVGEAVALEITPMLGVVFGSTTGIAPGYKGSLSWRRLALSSEGEYVVDANDSADSFLYTWSELTVAPADWWRLGLVVQRTKVYQTKFDIQRGLLVGFTFRNVDVTGHVFNPDEDTTVVLAVGVSF